MAGKSSFSLLSFVGFGAVVVLVCVGAWFAGSKSDKAFESKIDRLMFDKDNKAPKFVLTLPDLKEMKKQQRQPAVEEAELASTVRVSTKRTDIDTLEEAIANIPNLSQLKDKPATQELQHLMLAEDMSEQVGSLVLPKISPEGLKPWN